MFSFRSILLAVAAFATLTSAIPMPANTEGDDIATDFSNLANTVKKGFTNAEAIINAVEMDTRGNSYTPADSFKKCSDGLTVIVVKIKSAIYCEGGPQKVDHNVVIGLLRDILDLLVTLLAELKGGDYKGCDVSVLGRLVAGLLITIAEILALVIGVVGTVDKVLCGVIASISGLLCEVLQLVFGIVEGLLAAVVLLLVSPFADHCKSIGFLDVLAILDL